MAEEETQPYEGFHDAATQVVDSVASAWTPAEGPLPLPPVPASWQDDVFMSTQSQSLLLPQAEPSYPDNIPSILLTYGLAPLNLEPRESTSPNRGFSESRDWNADPLNWLLQIESTIPLNRFLRIARLACSCPY